MKLHMGVVAALTAGMIVAFAPAANADICVWCDYTGCHVGPPCQGGAAAAFTADVTLNGFGIGTSTGSAELCVNSVGACTSVSGSAGANAHADFTVNEGSSTCPVTGTAYGTVTGAITTSFTWTRVGAIALISTGGGGAGAAVFTVTSPIGNPCGTTGTVKATAVGVLAAP